MLSKKYIRDKRSPNPKSEIVSRVMSANRAKDTEPEILLRKELCKLGLRGYRLNYKKVPGKPDIAFVSRKVAIFMNGCFWHRCPHCNYGLPKNNTSFWINKFNANVARDKRKILELRKLGWYVYVFWECQLKNQERKLFNKIIKKLS